MFKLNESLINQSAETQTQTNQGGINMNNEQIKAMVMEAKQDLMNGLEKLNAIEAMLESKQVVEPTPAPQPQPQTQPQPQPVKEEAFDLNAMKDMFNKKTEAELEKAYEETDDDLIEELHKEFGPKDSSHDPHFQADGGLSVVDDAQEKAIADALDFMENPEEHDDAVIETEEEEEAPAPEEMEPIVSHVKEAVQSMPVQSVYEEMDTIDLSDEDEEDPFENVHVPTKREKREQEQAIKLELNAALIKQPVVKSPGVAVVSGPMDQSVLFNSGRISYKHGSDEFTVAMANYMTRGFNTLYGDGVREFRVPLFNGIELLVPLFWPQFKAEHPDAKLVVFDNRKSKFQQYKPSIEDEVAAGVYSPKRLSLMLLACADDVVTMKELNAFKLRELMAAGSDSYLRVLPAGHEDAANRFMGKTHKGIIICPWSLAVTKTGAYEPKFIQGLGVDFRPSRLQKAPEARV